MDLTRLFFSIIFSVYLVDASAERECNIFATILREIDKEGFHRELTSLVEIVNVHSNIENCHLALQETLPSNVFVNPDELKSLARQGVLFAESNSTIDIEAAESSSSPFATLIYASENKVTHNLLSAEFLLPIHVRYHSPMDGINFYNFVIKRPILFIRCSKPLENIKGCDSLRTHDLPCNFHSSQKCKWYELFYKTNAEKLYISVPVGNTKRTSLVIGITFLVTISGCICILNSLFSFPIT